MSEKKFKYEVAFSFLKQDEMQAYEINDKIQDRLETFIYSKKQEELGGTDGEKEFNQTFCELSRVVVILYRDGWGNTAWTRIEETAIKNRAFGKGWDFLLLINLDINSTLPTWIPKPYIWLDFQRFKADGAIAVIEQKVKQAGGEIRIETIEDRAERLKRSRALEKERAVFLSGHEAVYAAQQEVLTLIDKLKKLQPKIEDPSTNLCFNTHIDPIRQIFELSYKGYCLMFNNSNSFNSGIDYGDLRIFIYEKSGHQGLNYKEKIQKQIKLRFDRNLTGNNGWTEHDIKRNFWSTDEIIDKWVKDFLDDIERHSL